MVQIKLIQGNCLELMKTISNGSVDLILTDPPYGTMKGIDDRHDWDEAIQPNDVFCLAGSVLRRNGKLVLFSQEPYTSELIAATPPYINFGYRAVWVKDMCGNCLMAKKAMVGMFEDICIFQNKNDFGEINKCVEQISQYIQDVGFEEFATIMYREGRYKDMASAKKNASKKVIKPGCKDYRNFFDKKMYLFLCENLNMPYTFDEYFEIVERYKRKTKPVFNLWQGNKSKPNVLEYAKDKDKYHPTQKPIALLEDLIRTFSNEGDTVLDFTMGSGSTGVACVNTNRNFIGMELDKDYFKIAEKRIYEAQEQKQQCSEKENNEINPLIENQQELF